MQNPIQIADDHCHCHNPDKNEEDGLHSCLGGIGGGAFMDGENGGTVQEQAANKECPKQRVPAQLQFSLMGKGICNQKDQTDGYNQGKKS